MGGRVMKKLPRTEHSLLLRTDFSDDAAWASLCEAVQQENELGFRAFVECISDPAYNGLTVEQVVALAPKDDDFSFALIADRTTFTHPERPVLVVDLYDEPGRTFRVIPRATWAVENNLWLANADFSDFASDVDPDGVFRRT
jgi:hypothetical protein